MDTGVIKAEKKNIDYSDITISEWIREAKLCKPSNLAKKQPHSIHLVHHLRDCSCPYYQGGSSCADVVSAWGKQGWTMGCRILHSQGTWSWRWCWVDIVPASSAERSCLGKERASGTCVLSAQEWRWCYRATTKVKNAYTNEKQGLPVVVSIFVFGFQSTFLTSVLIKSVLPQPPALWKLIYISKQTTLKGEIQAEKT